MNHGCIRYGGALALSVSLVFLGAMCATAVRAPSMTNYVGLGACIVALTGAAFILRKQSQQRQERLDQFIADVCQVQPQQFAGEIDQLLSLVEPDQPFGNTLGRLRDYLVQLGHAQQSSERERAKAEVRYRRAVTQADRLSGILHGLREPVLAINAYNELTVANQSAGELFHFDIDDFEKQAIETLVECRELIDLLEETRNHRVQTRRTAEVAVENDAQEELWFNATAENIESADGDNNSGGAVVVLRDITDRKAIQRRHAEFVSAVSHEMKTPLASIKAYVELLADGEADDEATRDEFLGVINGQADRLQRLINNLLNIARIEAGVVNVNKEEQSLNDVLEEAFRVVQPAAEQKHIQLNAELSPLYLGVLIDRDMVLQSAINLLSNAVKYTPESGTVTIRSRTSDECVVIEVQDTGVGLCPEDADRVFDKFYRVKKDQNMAPGTGLGLPLAKHIVEDVHGGTLSVESVAGEGSTFRISLPTQKRT